MPAVRNAAAPPAVAWGCKKAGTSLSGVLALGDLAAVVITRSRPPGLLLGTPPPPVATAARLGLAVGEMAVESARIRWATAASLSSCKVVT